jgi:hypothetical protein
MTVRIERHAEPIPGYRLIERLGGGGFGEVWKAEAPGGLLKAIKFVYGDLQTAGDEGLRAEQELKALSRVRSVRHPYILSLERFDIIDGKLLIVMELADRNLWDRFRDCMAQGLPGIPREELLGYLAETAEALDLMNVEYQLQHLDIKPQNLFLVYNHIKVADFGLVKDLQGMSASVTGGITPVYAAPETFDGRVSRYCDQYSLAIVYQELLTGRRPFTATNVHQLILQHMQARPNLSALSESDQEVIQRALSKCPEYRFPSCMDLIRGLQVAGGGVVMAPAASETPSQPQGTSPFLRQAWTPGKKGAKGLGRNGAGVSTHIASEEDPLLGGPAEEKDLEDADASFAFREMGTRTALTGEGELFPALVIGLGQVGLVALRQLRAELHERFGSRQALPHVGLLYLDTDPNCLPAATGEGPGEPLHASEVLEVPLRRASHFLKPREGRPRIDTWFDLAMLYRIRRNLGTSGLRALGRLALFDNFRRVAGAVRAHLEACTEPEALTIAMEQTGLGFRGNWPRVYVVAGLGGGTGSGMFLDIAFVARHVLKALGYATPDIVGLFFLPSLGHDAGQQLPLGNTFAALTELNHFSSPKITFLARYDERQTPLVTIPRSENEGAGGIVRDSAPPFSRCVLLPLASEKDAPAKGARLGGEFLYLDLTTPLGRAADAARAEAAPAPPTGTTVPWQTFGLFRIRWPRHALLHRAARLYCRSLVARWMSKDSKPLVETVKELVRQQWEVREMGAEALISLLNAACEKALGRGFDTALAEISQPFTAPTGPLPDPQEGTLASVLQQLDELLGNPAGTTLLQPPGQVESLLRDEAEPCVRRWEREFQRLIGQLVEDPRFRLAGAEEAIRQLVLTIEQLLRHHEPLAHDFSEKALNGYERLKCLANGIADAKAKRRAGPPAVEAAELLRLYPRWRYNALILWALQYTYTSLRGYLSDQLRELTFHRLRLGDLLQYFDSPEVSATDEREVSGTVVFPPGCGNLEETLRQLVSKPSAEEWKEVDSKVQALLQRQFTGLGHVCTHSTNLLKKLGPAMVAEVVPLVEARLAASVVTDMYLERYPEGDKAQEGLRRAFAQAAPKIAEGAQAKEKELALVACPAGAADPRFLALVETAMPGAQMNCGPADEIVIYRELENLTCPDFEQAGPEAEEAYQQMMKVAHFTPHSRIDIKEWQALNPKSD